MDDEVTDLAARALQAARDRGVKVVTAESCTGGLVIAALTETPGASDVVDRGFVTYSNAAKSEMIGVPTALIDRHGAVSAEVAGAMASGALAASGADIAVAITGIAGPGGGSAQKPVGLVHFAGAGKTTPPMQVERRYGDPGRAEIRRRAVIEALNLLIALAKPPQGA
ncbi:Nicotinamide-nucleotide amidase [hydrothermal vent metagenome]|uniref:Nicotinamide-nucleotide amidase n=1 Tax=hydrothermal vent metagenome TaxID=652676 RepID=A0A3B0TZK1_9ZZZZ